MKPTHILAGAAGAAALVLLVMLLVQSFSLHAQIEQLRSDVDRTYQQNQSLEQMVNRLQSDLNTQLKQQGSLFAQSEGTLRYDGGQLKLEVSVLPKEVREGELITLTAGTASTAMVQQPDGSYRASLTLPLSQEEITPTVTLRSAAGVRQEVLDPLWAGDVLSISGISAYGQTDGGLRVYLGLDQDGTLSVPGDVDTLTLRVVDGDGNELGLATMVPSDPPESEHQTEEGLFWYAADVSAYIPGEQASLAFWAELHLDGGLTLCDLNPIVTWSQSPSSSSGTSGSCSLRPQTQE